MPQATQVEKPRAESYTGALKGSWPGNTLFAGLLPSLPHPWHFLGLHTTTLLYLNPCLGSVNGGASLSRPPSPHWDEGQLLMVTEDGLFIDQDEGQRLPQPLPSMQLGDQLFVPSTEI